MFPGKVSVESFPACCTPTGRWEVGGLSFLLACKTGHFIPLPPRVVTGTRCAWHVVSLPDTSAVSPEVSIQCFLCCGCS